MITIPKSDWKQIVLVVLFVTLACPNYDIDYNTNGLTSGVGVVNGFVVQQQQRQSKARISHDNSGRYHYFIQPSQQRTNPKDGSRLYGNPLESFSIPSMDTVIQSGLENLNNINEFISASSKSLLLQSNNNMILETKQEQLRIVLNTLQSFIDTATVQSFDLDVPPIITSILAGTNNLPPIALLLGSTFVTYIVLSTLFKSTLPAPPSVPYPNNNMYDAATARAYFDQRLLLVASRGLQIAYESFQFGIQFYLDQLKKENSKNPSMDFMELEERRGQELAALLTKLGPTFIKVGQSLSIRTDILSPAYIRGLATLQDQVPPFDTNVAATIMEKEWGNVPLSDIIEGGTLSAKPIAAASLGQVYKATLKDTGETVAIKVQRPNILEQIALDMYLLREIGAVLKRIFNLNSDTVGTVDAWGTGFVNELDYIQEAENAMQFNDQIQFTPLKDVVFSPNVISKYSTSSVLVTEWIDGERLDKSDSKDVSVLCSIAMNTYLTMLLEFGTLHCDPHPGNLLRTTKDGKLCILDWGMVTKLDSSLQLTLIEHMAHLTSADYEEIPRDLLLLGFIPPEKADLIQDSGVVETLGDIYGAWTAGGGVANIDVNKVIGQLQELTATKGNLFQIPPYFAYIAKSFSVLEGIGLSNQPGTYSIINECLPYVSKRLLSDKDTMGPALSTFIFGPDKSNVDRIVNYKRVKQLVEGFGQYTVSSKATSSSAGDGNVSPTSTIPRTQLIEEAVEQILDLVFTEEETPFQQIFIEQLAKIVSSSGRYMFTELRERTGLLPSGRTVLGTALDPLGLFRTSPLIRTNELDEMTVETTKKLIVLMQEQIQKSSSTNNNFDITTLSRDETLELSRLLVRKVWERRNGFVRTGNRFARTLLQLTAMKLEKGERDTRTLPPPRTTSSSSMTTAGGFKSTASPSVPSLESNPRLAPLQPAQQPVVVSSVGATVAPAVTTTSSRLDGARKLLDSIRMENNDMNILDEEKFSVRRSNLD